MVNQFWLLVFVIFFSSCGRFKENPLNSCNCDFKLEEVIGIYEESYTVPSADNRFWLEKVVLVTTSGNYGMGIPSHLKEFCPKINKLLEDKEYNPLFYGRDFYPKYSPGEVSKTTNLFYNADSSRILIAFNVRATVLRLQSGQVHCLESVKKNYYKVFYAEDIFEQEPLGLINSEYIGALPEFYIRQKKYFPINNFQSFKYETGD